MSQTLDSTRIDPRAGSLAQPAGPFRAALRLMAAFAWTVVPLATVSLATVSLATVSLATVSLATVSLASQTAQEPPRLAPQTALPAPLTAAAIEALLQQLDACYGRADLEGYLAGWQPDHPGAHAQLRRQLTNAFAMGLPLQRVSKLVGEPRRIGERTVVRVHHEVRSADGRSKATFAQDTMLAVRHAAAHDRAVPTFAIEIPSNAANVPNDLFRCPVCNYQIGGVPGWLCVPQRSDRAMALEAATFFLIGTDIACDISVQIDAGPPNATAASTPITATALAESLAAALRRLEPGAHPGLATAWTRTNQPPAGAGTSPTGGSPGGPTAARVTVELPADAGASDGGRAIFYTVALGALQHILLVRGSIASLQQHDAAVQALLASYRMLDADRDRALAAAEPLAYHTGGALRGTSYHNAKWQLQLDGPEHWAVEQRPGGALFRVVWSSPAGGRLWLLGYPVPAGMDRWCQETADLWLHELLAERGLRAIDTPAEPAAAWQEDASCEAASRLVTCTGTAPGGPVPQRRLLRLVVRDDLLVVVDAAAGSAAEWPVLQAAIGSLRLP